MRARSVVAAVAVVLAALAGCAPAGTDDGGGAGAVDAGYESGDGSFTTWEPDERGEPVEHTGTTYDGTEVDLASMRGDVVVLNFWYAACPPCRAEAPDLKAIAEDYTGQDGPGVQVLGVNPRDDTGTAQAFERTFDLPYPSLHDERAQAVAALEGVVPLQAMPSTVVIDREGRVAARVLGQADPEILRGLIDDVVAEGAGQES